MKSKVAIRYCSGREEQFEIELWGGASMEVRLQEFIQSPNLALQLEDEVIIIPATAIERISLAIPKEKNRVKEFSTIHRAKQISGK